MVAHAYNLNTWEAETGGSQVQGQPELGSKNFSNNNKKAILEAEEMAHS